MEENANVKRELSSEELEKVNGGNIPVCSHFKRERIEGEETRRYYLFLKKKMYRWHCLTCGKDFWSTDES